MFEELITSTATVQKQDGVLSEKQDGVWSEKPLKQASKELKISKSDAAESIKENKYKLKRMQHLDVYQLSNNRI